jgi:hypothetical protein
LGILVSDIMTAGGVGGPKHLASRWSMVLKLYYSVHSDATGWASVPLAASFFRTQVKQRVQPLDLILLLPHTRQIHKYI